MVITKILNKYLILGEEQQTVSLPSQIQALKNFFQRQVCPITKYYHLEQKYTKAKVSAKSQKHNAFRSIKLKKGK